MNCPPLKTVLNKPCVVEVEGDSPPILKRKVVERPINASVIIEDIDDSPKVKRRLLTRNNTAILVDEDDPGVLLSGDEEDDDDDASKDSWIVSDSEDDEDAASSVSDLPEEVEEMRQRSRKTNVMFARAFFAALLMHLRQELLNETCSLESLVGTAKHGKETLRAYRKTGEICGEIDENYASTSDARAKCGAAQRDNENTETCTMCSVSGRPVRWVYDTLQCCEACHKVVDVYKLARAFWPNVVAVITLLFKSAFSITVKTVSDLETVAKILTSDTPHVSRVYVLDEMNKLFIAHEDLQQKYKDAYDSVYLDSSSGEDSLSI
jgi:hypothetical protein